MANSGFLATALTLLFLQLNLRSASTQSNDAILHFIREAQENYHLDLIFILDSSPYVTEAAFYDTEREIVRQIIQQMVYIAPERTRITIITYSDSVSIIEDDITNGGDRLKCDFVQDFELWTKVKYHSSESQRTQSSTINLEAAFEAAVNVMNTGRQNRRQLRPGLKQLALLISAGKFYNQEQKSKAREQALKMQQQSGISLHGIALDNYADYNSVRDLLQIKDFISYASEWRSAFTNQYNNIGSFFAIGRTTGGTAQGQRCHFPFMYKSTLYTTCTSRDNNGVPWCATTPQYQDVWGVCIVDRADLRPYSTNYSSACSCKGGAKCVCDVVTGYTKCLCPPGKTWTSTGCKDCPTGTYKSIFGDEDCELCPPRGVTPEGATSINQCQCNGVACYDECRVRDHCTRKRTECITSEGSQSVECRCIKGYTGSNCDLTTDDCRGAPCAQGSVCIDGYEDYICICAKEKYGKNCTETLVINSCSAMQCQINADCYIENGAAKCRCRNGYIQYGIDCIANRPVTDSVRPLPTKKLTTAPLNPVTPTTKDTVDNKGPDYNDYNDYNGVIPDPATDNSKATPGKGILGIAGGSKEEMTLLIAIPICVVAVIAVASTIYALYSVSHHKKQQQKQEQRRSRSNSKADTTSETTQFTSSTTVSMSDLKKKHEGFNVNMDAVYGNEPVEYGMGEWYYYTLDLIHNGILNTVAIVRLDGKKWILSPGCYLYKEEIETIYSALTQKSINVRLSYQIREYGIINNDDMLMVAHSTSDSNTIDSPQEILCAAKTRQFVVICTATFSGDEGKCKIESQRLRDHIKSQGL